MLKNVPEIKRFLIILMAISLLGLIQSDYYFLCSKSKDICILKEDGVFNFQKNQQSFKLSDIKDTTIKKQHSGGRHSSSSYQAIINLKYGNQIYYLDSTSLYSSSEDRIGEFNKYRNSNEETFMYEKNKSFIRQLSIAGMVGGVILFFMA